MAHYSAWDKNPVLNTHRMTRNDILPPAAKGELNPQSPTGDDLVMTSTNIFIYANDSIVGMIQSFSISESRTINKLQAVGYEGVVQAVPSNTNGGQLSVSRMALYQSNLWNALGLTMSGVAYNPVGSKVYDNSKGDDSANNNANSLNTYTLNPTPKNPTNTDNTISSKHVFKTLKDQRVPLEIQVRTRLNGTGSTDSDFYIETYVDCWLSSYSKSYTVQSITVAEQATIQYADVY